MCVSSYPGRMLGSYIGTDKGHDLDVLYYVKREKENKSEQGLERAMETTVP